MTQQLKTILCIDDDPDVLLVVQLCLETVGGFTVTGAASGPEAIAKAAQHVPDLILLDVMMPAMDGPTTLKNLRENKALEAVPVIFVTARIQQSEINEYLIQGANGVLAKPFDPMALADQVKALWEQFHVGR